MMRRLMLVLGLLLLVGAVAAFAARRASPARSQEHPVRPADAKPTAPTLRPLRPAEFRLPRARPADHLGADLHDGDPAVRHNALWQQMREDTREAGLAILEALRDPAPQVSEAAALGAGHALQAGTVTAAEVVALVRLPDLPTKTHLLLLSSLGSVQSAEGTQLLLELARSGTAQERSGAVLSLGNQGVALAAPALVAALADEDDMVWHMAHDQLLRLGQGRDFGRDQDKWRAWLEAQGVAMSARPKSGSH